MSNKKQFRVGLIGIAHESNTFINSRTTLQEFEDGHLFYGQPIVEEYRNAYHEVGGIIEVLSQQDDITLVPLMYAEATPGGKIDAKTSQFLTEKMVEIVKKETNLDGLMVVPHGAGVSETHDDFDGYWLQLMREQFEGIPIVGTMDPHGNLSALMVEMTDALVAYKTNPHVDQRDVGREAAWIMVNALRGKSEPVQVLGASNVAISIEQQFTAGEPCLSLYGIANDLCQKEGVLSISILLGFPYADVYDMGTSFLVVTDNDKQLATDCTTQLINYLHENHRDFVGEKVSVEQALVAVDKAAKPVLLLDMGDNVGGGSPGDSTFILEALDAKSECRSFVCIQDPEAVAQLAKLSPGAELELAMGAKTDNLHGKPFQSKVTLLKMVEGRFTESQPRHGGQVNFDMGPTAIVKTNNDTTIMLTTLRTVPFSLQQMLHFDILPEDFDVIVAKGVQAPIAAYASVCPTIIRVNTAGVTTADMLKFEYKNRRSPLYPFEDI